MAGISSSVGLVSGIDSKSIIDQLMTLEQQPKLKLQARMATQTAKKTAYATIQAQVTSLRLFGTQVKKPQTFRNADVKSTDEGVLTGTASAGAAAGSYQVSVARLVSSQQTIGRGFADAKAKPGAGTVTVELGGAALDEPTELDDLNGGKGVSRGKFRLTDRSGASTIIDAGDAMTLNDVVDKINQSLDVSVHAAVQNNALVLTDQTGSTSAQLRVQDVGNGTTAAELGIAGSANSATLAGTALNGLRSDGGVADLYDGRGLRTAGAGQADFSITLADGSTGTVSLSSAATLGDVLAAISNAIPGKLGVSMSSAGFSIRDNSADYSDPDNPVAQPIQLTALNGSKALDDLGLNKSATADGKVVGDAIGGGVNTTMIASLRGGKGLDLGTIHIKDRNGTTRDVDLSSARSVQDILDKINTSGVNVRAEVKSGGNSITLTDLNNRGGTLSVSDVSGQTAAELGLAGNFTSPSGGDAVSGANLQKAWFTRNTLLRDVNGGKGVPDGKFTLTDSAGKTQTITVDSTKDATVGDVIDKINAVSSFGVKASINANGDGLLLTDTAGGTGTMKVADLNNGTVAKSLNIAGTPVNGVVDGSWEKTITVKSTDTLETVQAAIQNLNWGLSATLINDGSDDAPVRLSLTSTNSGKAGRVVFDSGATNLGERTLVAAQDAAAFVGGDGGVQPMLVRSGSNTISNAIRGVTLELTGVSEKPVTVNVARNVDNIVDAAGKFVEGFNALATSLQGYTKFDSATNTRGDLLGDPAALSVETEMYAMLNTVGNPSGKYRIPADVGFTLGSDGQLQFDEEKFRAAFADDPDAVTTLFTRGGAALEPETRLATLRSNAGIRQAPGADFRITSRDATTFDVDLADATTISDVIKAINDASGNAGKVTAQLNTAGTGIDLVDNATTGAKKFAISGLNGSVAASDLGLLVTSSSGRISGKSLIDANAGDDGGIGTMIEKRLSRLIDPVTGSISQASKQVDDRNTEFQQRIDSLDDLLAAKRTRLEKQFSGLESSLSGLQSQQTALSQLGSVSAG